jgi:hypothetical protein
MQSNAPVTMVEVRPNPGAYISQDLPEDYIR